jgi:CASC3/Barentsz eIF4AIII binding
MPALGLARVVHPQVGPPLASTRSTCSGTDMVAPRRKDMIARRRRAHDDDGEDDGSLAAGMEDDSSQASLPSEVDDDADGEGSDTSDQAPPKKNGVQKQPADVPSPVTGNGRVSETTSPTKATAFATVVADTEAMLNGMKISGNEGPVEEVDFEGAVSPTQQDPASAPAVAEKPESLAERRRREHGEYKRRRDADPAFVPNRGGFFMHDQRSSAAGQNGLRTAGRGGRGRGRGFGGPFSPLG